MIDPVLAVLAPWQQARRWWVALSGGLDSTVLLHLLVQARARQPLPELQVIHIDHGLQVASAQWVLDCQALCRQWQVPLRVERVVVAPGASLERQAREARYAVWNGLLEPGDVLLTAQHVDDQLETLLFRLLRGAGVRGLQGMPLQRALGQGTLVRPLLAGISRSMLLDYARQHELSWVEDPSNRDLRLSRNFLRQQILPELQQHWPGLRRTLLRTSEHMREAGELLDELALEDLRRCERVHAWMNLPCLDLDCVRMLSDARQRNLLRFWLRRWTLLPDQAHWQGWLDLRDAGGDRQPFWSLATGCLYRDQQQLWFVPSHWSAWSAPDAPLPLQSREGQVELSGNGVVTYAAAAGNLVLGYRQGGERVRVSGRGWRDLKRLLNEARIPAFVRARLPLLWQGDELVAVANLPDLAQPGYRLDWSPAGLS